MHVLEQMPRCTVRIEALLGEAVIGTDTGFYYGFCLQPDGGAVNGIVTNKHVIAGAAHIRIRVHVTQINYEPHVPTQFVSVDIPLDSVVEHPNPAIDLCVVPAQRAFDAIRNMHQMHPSFIKLAAEHVADAAFLEQLLPFESVRMVGYPIGIWDHVNNAPIVRRGSLATSPSVDYMGRPEFVVDIACFAGSSGSPVFVADAGGFGSRNGAFATGSRLALIGILYAGPVLRQSGEIVHDPIPVAARLALPDAMINLGYVIKAGELHEIDKVLATMLTQQPTSKAASFSELFADKPRETKG